MYVRVYTQVSHSIKKGLTAELNNNDNHVMLMQRSARNRLILEFMWMPLDTNQPLALPSGIGGCATQLVDSKDSLLTPWCWTQGTLSGSVFMPQQVWAGPIQGGASMYRNHSRMSNRSNQIWNWTLWRPDWHLELFATLLQLLLNIFLQCGRAHRPAGCHWGALLLCIWSVIVFGWVVHVKWHEWDEPKQPQGGQRSSRCSYENLNPWSKTEQCSAASSLLIQQHWQYLASLDYHSPSESLFQSDVRAVSQDEAQPCLVVFS